MKNYVFDSKLLPNGNLYCPKELAKENARYKVTVTLESEHEASKEEIELSTLKGLIWGFFNPRRIRILFEFGRL